MYMWTYIYIHIRVSDQAAPGCIADGPSTVGLPDGKRYASLGYIHTLGSLRLLSRSPLPEKLGGESQARPTETLGGGKTLRHNLGLTYSP